MKYDIEQLLEAGEVIQIYPEGYSMYRCLCQAEMPRS